MARYFAFVRKRVVVRYRAGEVTLYAHGLLVGDTGKSLFLEEHCRQRGRSKTFRWEIPYPAILSLTEAAPEPAPPPDAEAAPADSPKTSASALGLKTRPEKA
jgi:hypothetical protein